MPTSGAPCNTSLAGCIVRLSWMLFGNLILVLCLIGITHTSGRIFALADGIYMATVAAMIAMRYVDIRRYSSATASGEPATLAEWRGYSWQVVGFAGAAWCLARGYAFLSRVS